MVYLLHFDRPYEHCRHFIGIASSVEHLERIVADPQNNNGARLLVEARIEGVTFHVGNVWFRNDDFAGQLRRQHRAKDFCATCTPAAWTGDELG